MAKLGSQEWKDSISKALRGKKLTQQHRKNISRALRGKKKPPFTQQHRENLGKARRGRHHSQQWRKNISKGLKGKYTGTAAPRWKGGRIHNSHGYMEVYKPDHKYASTNHYVLEHRVIMEQYLGRILDPTEIVHHINGDVKDNREENLMLFSNRGAHLTWHRDLYEKQGKKWGGNHDSP